MAIHPLWEDAYWLLLLQLYLKTPAGVKAVYSRPMVNLGLELHIEPLYLHAQMSKLEQCESPKLKQLYDHFAGHPKRLAREVARIRSMKGFGKADIFYEGVATRNSFENDFRPLPTVPQLCPVMLILVLDLYFRLTPLTMVAETPEVQELGKLMGIEADTVVDVFDTFQACDPYLNRTATRNPTLLAPCQKVWNRYGNDNPQFLASAARQLSAYFKD